MKTINVTGATPQTLIPINTTGRKRWWIIQSDPANTTNARLQFDKGYNPNTDTALSTTDGYVLLPGESRCSTDTPWGGSEAEGPVLALAVSGTVKFNVQGSTFNNES